MIVNSSWRMTAALAAGILAAGMSLSAADAPSVKTAPQGKPMHYRPERFSRRASLYYNLIWGVDSLHVKAVESGEIVRFTFRVIDADKAKPLNDVKYEPSLEDPRAGVKLVVPELEKVGKLRNKNTPEDGRVYWMAFSNKGRPVKVGDHVNVVIGKFRADGLVVE